MNIKKCWLLATIGVIFLSGINLVEASNAIIWDTGTQEDKFYRITDSNAWANKANWIQVPYGNTNYNFVGDAILDNGNLLIFLHSSGYDSPFMYAVIDGTPSATAELYNSCEGNIWNTRKLETIIIKNSPDEVIVQHNTEHSDPVTYPGVNRVTYTMKNDAPWVEVNGVNEGMYYQSIHAQAEGFAFAPPNIGTTGNDFVVDARVDAIKYPNTWPVRHYPPATHNEMVYQEVTTWGHNELYIMMPENPVNGKTVISVSTVESPYFDGVIEQLGVTGVSNHGSILLGAINHGDTIKSTYPNIHVVPGQVYTTSFIEPVHGKWRLSGRVDGKYYTSDITNGDFTFTSPVTGTLEAVTWYLYDRTANTPANVYTPMDMYRAAHKETTPTPSIELFISIRNPGFESGRSPWLFHTSGTGTFSVESPGFEGNNAAKLALNSGGTNIQLYQTGATLEPNTRYRLSFAGYSTTGHNLNVRLIKHVSPYTNYGLDFTADLGTSWRPFTTEFTTTGFTGTVNDGRLMFWLAPFAASGDTYYIDDIRLELVNEPDVTKPDVTEPDVTEPVTTEPDTTKPVTTEPDTTGTTVIQNPGFESGTTPWLFHTNGMGTFLNDASGDGSPHAGHLTISQEGSNVQLYQPGLVLEPNTLYRLNFKAYSNTGHDLSISLHKHGSPYTNFGLSNYVFNLGTSWSEYSTQFTTSGFSGTVNDGRLRFWLSPYDAIGDQYFIDDVILVKV